MLFPTSTRDAGVSDLLNSLNKHAIVVSGGFYIQECFVRPFFVAIPFGLLKIEVASEGNFRLCYGRVDRDWLMLYPREWFQDRFLT